jgi:hypothetical protein
VIGSGSGQAARVVQVYGLIVPPVRAGGFYIDRYAVLDRDGRFLAGFPSGADGSSGAEGPEVDASAAWYPSTNVAGLARSAGMVFGQDQVDTPREVIDQYPGLLDHPRWVLGLTYANTVICVPGGLFLIVFPEPAASRRRSHLLVREVHDVRRWCAPRLAGCA